MIHKFEGMAENVNTRKNVFVLVDEAHRTTGGKLGNYLMGALPNATYIGFTGTPIDKTSYGKGRVFYCAFGHRTEIWWNPTILRFYLDGIQFAVGDRVL